MIRAYCILAAAAALFNGPVLEPWMLAWRQQVPRPAIAQVPAAPAAFGVEAEKGRDGLFRVTGLANRRRVRFVVDTGATVTVLTAHDADRLRLRPSPDRGPATLRTAGGAASMRWRRLERLDVAGAHLTGLDVVVVVAGGLDHSLLGQDILSRLGTVTIAGERLAIRPPRA